MSNMHIRGYRPPLYVPQLTLARVSGWEEDEESHLSLLPGSFSRIGFNQTENVFVRIQRNKKKLRLANPYKLRRQLGEIVHKQLTRQTTLQQAREEMLLVRDEFIKLMKKFDRTEARVWRRRLTRVFTSIENIMHDSVEQMRERLTLIVRPGVLETEYVALDSVGREGNSGGIQAMLSASGRRCEEAELHFFNVRMGIRYYLMVVDEFIKELETKVAFVEMYVRALHFRAFGNNLFEGMREGQAARYCLNHIIDIVDNYFWCSPFMEHRAGLRSLAERGVSLMPRDESEIEPDRWSQIIELTKEMLAILNRLQVDINLNHLRQGLAESIVGGQVTGDVLVTMKNTQQRTKGDGLNPDAVVTWSTIKEALEGDDSTNTLVTCYETVGDYLTPKPPAGKGDEVAKAVTTA